MFSVIIPLYNKERHIEETIQTVLDQTFEEYEIIVVNDGSTDKGADIVKEIHSDKIRLINQENKGVSVARNRGAEEATYDHLVFLDADDGLLPKYLSKIKMLIDKFPEAAIYASNLFVYKKTTGEYIAQMKDFLPEKGIVNNYFYHLVNGRKILGCVSTIRKESFFKVGGYQAGMKRAQDTHLFTRLLMTEKMAFINKHLYYYTIGSDNQATDMHHIFSTKYSLIDYVGMGNEFADEFIVKYSIGHVKTMIRFGHKNEAKLLLKKIVDKTPDEIYDFINDQRDEIELLMKYPILIFAAKRHLIRVLVKLKDLLKNLNLIESHPNKTSEKY